jgi:hypothetical protein
MNGDNRNKMKRLTGRHLKKKKRREYLKDKINEPATRSKNNYIRELYRGINVGHKSKTNSAKR